MQNTFVRTKTNKHRILRFGMRKGCFQVSQQGAYLSVCNAVGERRIAPLSSKAESFNPTNLTKGIKK